MEVNNKLSTTLHDSDKSSGLCGCSSSDHLSVYSNCAVQCKTDCLTSEVDESAKCSSDRQLMNPTSLVPLDVAVQSPNTVWPPMSVTKNGPYKYGWWCLTPFCLQRFLNNAKAFVVLVTLANVLQGVIVNGLLKVNVTSIERRYKLLSSESGLVISSYDIAGCLCLLPISYIGGKGHKPRWISVGVLLLGLGSLVLAMPRFLAGPYQHQAVFSSNNSPEWSDSALCKKNEYSKLHSNSSNRTSFAHELDLCDDNSHSSDRYLQQMKYVFILGQFFNGIGNTPLGVLAVTFIDESVDKRVYPIYIGIYYMGALLGPAIGFVFGAQLLTTFTNLGESPKDLTPDSPSWIGAWWVGFIVTGAFTILLSFPLFGYPRKLNCYPRKHKERGSCYSAWWRNCCLSNNSHDMDVVEDDMHNRTLYQTTDPSRCYNTSIEETVHPLLSKSHQPAANNQTNKENSKDKASNTATVLITCFFRDILAVIVNKSFIFLSLSAAIYSTLVSGFSTFGPKFIESQLGKSAANAANLFGYVCIPAGAGGMLIGALLMTGLKMNQRSALQMCIGVSIAGLLAQFVLVLNCDDLDLAGVTVPYEDEKPLESNDPMMNISSACNSACMCSPVSKFNPVCGSDGKTYFSPCHAGCMRKETSEEQEFFNCSCIIEGHSASSGRCAISCQWQNLILLSLFIVILSTFVCTVPGVDLSLRCFPYHQRPLAIGVQWVLIRTLGSIPGPIIFGLMIDSTCLLWGEKSLCSEAKGSCLMYRNSELSSSFLVLSVIYKAAGIVTLCLALVYINQDTVENIETTTNAKIVELPMSTSQQSTSGIDQTSSA